MQRSLAVILSMVISFSEIGFEKAIGAVVTTLNNNGPFFGLHKAMTMQISSLSALTKSILITAMIVGRVEFVLFFMILSKAF